MKVPTPTDLVRARWSAYALKLPDFIIETTHPDNESYDSNVTRWRLQVEAYCLRNVFYELNIVSAEDDKVSYKADILAYMSQPITMSEDSVFAQVDGEWKFLCGEVETVEHDRDEWMDARMENSRTKIEGSAGEDS